MNEEAWRNCTQPERMLTFLDRSADRRLSLRKRRLFAVACCRSAWALLPDEGSREVLRVSEAAADGLASTAALQEALRVAGEAVARWRQARDEGAWQEAALCRAWRAAWAATAGAARVAQSQAAAAAGLASAHAVAGSAGVALRGVWREWLPRVPAEMLPGVWQALALPAWRAVRTEQAQVRRAREEGQIAEQRRQSDLLRDLVGSPFRPPPLVDGWLPSTVRAITQRAYDEGDFAALPVLADALEEAGCTDGDVLAHLRGPGPHARGCWALDLLLGKE